MANVTFNIEEFRSMYPQFSSDKISDDVLNALYLVAVDIVGDTDENSFAPYDPENGIKERKILLYTATCHLATMHLWPDGQSGRIASASEGSVSTSFDLIKPNGGYTAQYWTQTKCGQLFWLIFQKYTKGGRFYAMKHVHPWG